ERFFRFPLRMLRRDRLHAINREEELEIHWLLTPERSVVIERGDALLERNKIRRAFLGDLSDEFGDGLLGRAVIPRSERVGSPRDSGGENQRANERSDEEALPARRSFSEDRCVSRFHCCV